MAIAAGFIAAAVLMTWPLAAHLSTAVHDPTDPLVSASILDWDLYALFHHPLKLFEQPIFYPAHDALAFTEHLFGIALVVLPFRIAGASPVALHSLAIILGFAFCGYGASVLGRVLTRSTPASLVGGAFFAFVPYRFHHITHVSYVWAGWLPLLLAALLWYARRPSWRRALLFGMAFFFNGLTCLHWLAFGSIAIVLTAIFIAAAEHRFLDGQWWLRVGCATAIASIALAPWLVPYHTVATEYGMQRSWAETKPYSAHWRDWFTPARENSLYGQLVPDEAYEAEHPLFPGVLILILFGSAFAMMRREDLPSDERERCPGEPGRFRFLHAIDAVIALALLIALFGTIGGPLDWEIGGFRLIAIESPAIPISLACALLLVRLWIRLPRPFRSRSLAEVIDDSRFSVAFYCALLWIAVGVLGSFGLDGFFHQTLFRLFPPVRGIRVPLRWAMITYVGLSGVAAVGMLPFLRRASRIGRWGISAAACAAILFECHAFPFHWSLIPERVPPVYRWLSSVAFKGAVAELPMGERFSDYEYLLRQTTHHHPLINGISSFVPARYFKLADAAHRDPIDATFISSLEQLGAALVVVHVDDLYEDRPAVRQWLKEELAAGRLEFVRRFDHDVFGDYVFAVTRNCRPPAAWRAPERADPSGRTPSQTLAAFLNEDAFTFNSESFGMLGSPIWGQDFRRVVNVSGWAMSPHGIKAVNLLFDDAGLRVPATLSDAPYIRKRMPWYPASPGPSFSAVVPVPRGAHGRTDIEVQIVDGAGRLSRLDDVEFRWSNQPGLAPGDWNATAVYGLLERMGMDPASARPALLKRSITAADLSDRLVSDSKRLTDVEFVERCYAVFFERPADELARRRWTDKLARGMWRRSVADALVSSDEFARKYLAPGVRMEPLR